MNYLRAFITGAVIGGLIGLAMAIWTPLADGRFPRTPSGLVAAFAVIEWFPVLLLTAIFSVAWMLFEFRAVRKASDAYASLDLFRDLWHLLTFWRR